MKISQYPNPERIAAFLDNDDPKPVVMVNLLKFKARADAPDEGLSGAEAYMRYGAAMTTLVQSVGGRIIWSGRVTDMVIGESDVDFDVVALMEYPSRRAFAQLVRDARVQEISVHRTAGLQGQWLFATTQTS
ncbi:MAG TPA: DUF1330 domain-containing protein [Pseudomonadales bacterium]|nr:DUF1330 domain-containing protein [Pseudomonadales bacterium]